MLTHTWSTIPLVKSATRSIDDRSISLSVRSETDDITTADHERSDEDAEGDGIADTADCWMGEVETGPGGNSVTLVARFNDMSEFMYLLEYQVCCSQK